MDPMAIPRRSPATTIAAAALVVACLAFAVSLGGGTSAGAIFKDGIVKERHKMGTALDGNFENVEARCKSGYNSISGGYSMSPDSDAVVYETTQNTERGWSVGVRNPAGGPGGDVTFFVLVYCMKV